MEGGETVVVFLDAVKYRVRHPEGEFVTDKKRFVMISYHILLLTSTE